MKFCHVPVPAKHCKDDQPRGWSGQKHDGGKPQWNNKSSHCGGWKKSSSHC